MHISCKTTISIQLVDTADRVDLCIHHGTGLYIIYITLETSLRIHITGALLRQPLHDHDRALYGLQICSAKTTSANSHWTAALSQPQVVVSTLSTDRPGYHRSIRIENNLQRRHVQAESGRTSLSR